MRLFVAIELSDTMRKALHSLQDKLASRCRGVRRTNFDQLHVTLKFIGDVADARVAGISSAVARVAERVTPFSMALSATGCFPKRGPVRIVWAGLDDPSNTLARCAEAVDAELADLGFAGDAKPFSPHVTVGRVREDRTDGLIRRATTGVSPRSADQRVKSISLMSSELAPTGPTYTCVCRAKLGGA